MKYSHSLDDIQEDEEPLTRKAQTCIQVGTVQTYMYGELDFGLNG